MNLTVRIHDIEYTKEVAQGVTFSEEYNETLDSGAIRLTHIKQIANLRPYDDVYIYESAPENYEGDWYVDNVVRWRSGGTLHDGDEYYTDLDGNRKKVPFYRHLLVDNYTESLVNIGEGIMSYNIELFSETKRLEMIQLPNICVTQPIKISKRHTIWWLLNKYVDTYSPKIKQPTYNGGWRYVKKYKVDPSLKKVFGSAHSQDFSLQNPTLRDVLSSLMVTKDMIPYVKDDVIYAKDIGHKTQWINIQAEKESGRISTIAGQMASTDYCDGVRRQYSNALSSDGVCTFVEYLGFRNRDSSLMSLSNIRLELGHPIYRIKKCNLCYYTTGVLYDMDEKGENIYGSQMLVKHNITPLIKQKEEWSLLSQDWREFSNNSVWEGEPPTSMADLAKYQLSTVYYSQGGTTIDGWGEKYIRLETSLTKMTSWNVEVTRLENILNWLDEHDVSGDVSAETYENYIHTHNIGSFDENHDILAMPSSYKNMFDAQYANPTIKHRLSTPQKMKTIFFEIEYEGFYDGAIVHSRDKGNDNIIQNDNSSGSLVLLGKDGTSQKAKVNRFANKTYSMKGRLDGHNLHTSAILPLGGYCDIGDDDNVIVYHREYSIYDNYILTSYACIQDYVLKNFYTSVYAKYRINQLMSYGESVNRSENEKVILTLSKTKKYLNESDTFFSDDLIADYFSAFKQMETDKNINMAMVLSQGTHYDSGSLKNYLVDCNTFTSGNSMCINIAMPDNISGGTHIKSWSSDYKLLVANPSDEDDYVIGSEQQWNDIVDDDETGEIESINFQTGHLHVNDLLLTTENDKVAGVYNYLQKLPSLEQYAQVKDIMQITPYMSTTQRYKDNKERIDTTLQIETIADTQDIIVSPKLVQLSDLVLADTEKKSDTIQKVAIVDTTGGNEIPFYIAPEEIEWGAMYFASSGTALSDFFSTAPENTAYPFVMAFDVGITILEIKTRFSFSATSIYWSNEQNYGTVRTYWYVNGEGYYGPNKINKLKFVYLDASKNFPINGYYLSSIYRQDGSSIFLSHHRIDDGETQTCIALFAPNGITKHTRENIFSKNMYVQYGINEIKPTIVDEVLPYTEVLPDGFQQTQKVGDIFVIRNISEGSDEPTLLVDVTYTKGAIERGEIKSINYWYLDFDSAYNKCYDTAKDYLYEYTPTNSGYQFVFGVNVSKKDLERKIELDGKTYIPIYISKQTNRDTRMYDDCGVRVNTMDNELDGTTSEKGLKGTYVVIPMSFEPELQNSISYEDTIFTGMSTTDTTQISGYVNLYDAYGKVIANEQIDKKDITADEDVSLLHFAKDGSIADLVISQSEKTIYFSTGNTSWRVEFVVTSIDKYVGDPRIEAFSVKVADDVVGKEGEISFYVDATIKNQNADNVYARADIRCGNTVTMVWSGHLIKANKASKIEHLPLTQQISEEQSFKLDVTFADDKGNQIGHSVTQTITLATKLQAPSVKSLILYDDYLEDYGGLVVIADIGNPNNVKTTLATTATVVVDGETKELTRAESDVTISAGKSRYVAFTLTDVATDANIELASLSASLSADNYVGSNVTTAYTYGAHGDVYEANTVNIVNMSATTKYDGSHTFSVTLLNTNIFNAFVYGGITFTQGNNSWNIDDETKILSLNTHTYTADTENNPAFVDGGTLTVSANMRGTVYGSVVNLGEISKTISPLEPPTLQRLVWTEWIDPAEPSKETGIYDAVLTVNNPNIVDCTVACNVYIEDLSGASTTRQHNVTVSAGQQGQVTFSVSNMRPERTSVKAQCMTESGYTPSAYTTKAW